MYIATFYSFKGGVGRTMALVNVAVSLALRGRRVLAVDFDVEAPGLDTFDLLRPQEEVPGVIDFVTQYLDSGSAPEASGFISQCDPIGEKGGGLWIMPSGKTETYSANFKQVDWGDLYERHDGYLLFEDLKAQWNQVVKPDYVLIDSRTGHTDIGGICTRHLPDSVTVFFFPNEQNLRGLTEVVNDIRAEAEEPRDKAIKLHFVMSNVPDLDDEDQILRSKIKDFQTQLGFGRELLVVHRYDSLSLLDQVVFSKDRPKSRLAREYRRIVREISAHNLNDRDGALEYIRRSGWRRRSGRDVSAQEREKMLERIEKAHKDDGEVLYRLSELRQTYSQSVREAALIDRAIEAGYEEPEAYLRRSFFRGLLLEDRGAKEDAWRVLSHSDVAPSIISEAISRLASVGASDPEEIVNSPAVKSLDLDDGFWLFGTLNRDTEETCIAVKYWETSLRDGSLPESRRNDAKFNLGLSYMGSGRCAEAARLFRDDSQSVDDLDMHSAFNYGMARWGADKVLDADAFRRVVDLDRSDNPKNKTPNHLQCMAIAYWACDDPAAAIDFVESAVTAVTGIGTVMEFSCWRYQRTSAELFAEDLGNIRNLINGHAIVPIFFSPPSGKS